MAHTYAGLDPFTPPSYTSGKGRFISGTATDDGDKRTAALAMILAQACMDSLQWVAWRTINIIEGGSYSNATLTFSGGWVFQGTTTINSGGVLAIASTGGATMAAGSSFVITSDSGHHTGITVTGTGGFLTAPEGNFTVDNISTANVGALNVGSTVRTGVESPNGTGAYRNERIGVLSISDPGAGYLWIDTTGLSTTTINATQADTWLIGVLDGALALTISNSATKHKFVVMSEAPLAQAYDVTIKSASTTQIGKLLQGGSTYPTSAAIHFQFSGNGNGPLVTMIYPGMNASGPLALALGGP
jgi:hypothetical protein